MAARAFVHRHLDVLLFPPFELDPGRAFEIVAHAATETGWGAWEIANNAGGIKAREADAARYLRDRHHSQPWYQRPGHLASGDGAVALYQGFDTTVDYWSFWLDRYVPQAGAKGGRYTETGAAFWSPAPALWFPALLLAGYRGSVRQAEVKALVDAGRDPGLHASVRAHRAGVARVRALAAMTRA